MRQSGIL